MKVCSVPISSERSTSLTRNASIYQAEYRNVRSDLKSNKVLLHILRKTLSSKVTNDYDTVLSFFPFLSSSPLLFCSSFLSSLVISSFLFHPLLFFYHLLLSSSLLSPLLSSPLSFFSSFLFFSLIQCIFVLLRFHQASSGAASDQWGSLKKVDSK